MILDPQWQKPTADLQLSEKEIHIWCASVEQLTEELSILEKFLSPAETARAQKFVFDKDRLRYILGKGLLRRLLGQYLNLPPEQIEFIYAAYGKPSVSPSQNFLNLHFNTSDSADLLMTAISRNINLGVDVEFMRTNLNIFDIAKSSFTPKEYQALQATEEHQQLAMFYRLWTRKEAFVKDIGMGLYYPLEKVDVLADLTIDQNTDNEHKLYSLITHANYQAALSIANISVNNIAFWRF